MSRAKKLLKAVPKESPKPAAPALPPRVEYCAHHARGSAARLKGEPPCTPTSCDAVQNHQTRDLLIRHIGALVHQSVRTLRGQVEISCEQRASWMGKEWKAEYEKNVWKEDLLVDLLGIESMLLPFEMDDFGPFWNPYWEEEARAVRS